VGARRKKPPISDTSHSYPVATVGLVGIEGGEERKELKLEEWIIWSGIAEIWF
jgi:hypothetical protein